MKPDLYAQRPSPWLRLLSLVYGLLQGVHFGLYRIGVLKPSKLPVRVVSVGNLTVGGTGKTPMTALVAAYLRDRGCGPAVLSRGYGRTKGAPVNVVSDGASILLGPEQAGDEAHLLARSLPGVPVLTGPDRRRLGRHAIEKFGSRVLVLDDGFQHYKLARDLDLVLLDAQKPWGNGWLLPAGPLREPRRRAGRAHAFVLTRSDVPDVASTLKEIRRDFPGRPGFRARHRPARLRALDDGTAASPDYLMNRKISAFCGLAVPQFFKENPRIPGRGSRGFHGLAGSLPARPRGFGRDHLPVR